MDEWLTNAQERAAIDAFDDMTLSSLVEIHWPFLAKNCHLTNYPEPGL